ncbi:MAG: peptide-methionine (S)-S-oxide reductase [Fretibacterium sp.]|nr:peptide-methionine (S)-S-oxide reductase [Fretibacterium sp.]
MSMMPIMEGRPRLDEMVPQELRQALFALGCFRRLEARFGLVRGVWRTVVGYAGGETPDPVYSNVGDHMEVVLVEYDPHTVSYGQLLELAMFWQGSEPCPRYPRHAPCLFVSSGTERRLAQAAVDRSCFYCDNETLILPLKLFHRAEAWCQKHYLRVVSWLFEELLNFYPDEEALLHSTMAARLNGYLGLSQQGELPESLELYGLSPSALEMIRVAGASIASSRGAGDEGRSPPSFLSKGDLP